MAKKTAVVLALLAALGSTYGGLAFLHKNAHPTLREVYKACEAGDVNGVACCEDMNRVANLNDPLPTCGMIKPGAADPYGMRAKMENDWDAMNAEQQKALQ